MFTWNFTYLSQTKLKEVLEQLQLNQLHNDILVRIHTSIHTEEQCVELAQYIKELIPAAHILGTSTSAILYKGKLIEDQCLISITKMDKGSIHSVLLPTLNKKGELICTDVLCKELGDAIVTEHSKLMFSFFTSRYKDIYHFVEECNDYFPGIQMVGGVANIPSFSQDQESKNGFIFNEELSSDTGAIFATINGEQVESLTSYASGVEVLGDDLEITDTFSNCILSLNGEDAAHAYRHVVGDQLRDNPELTNLFPYVYSDSNDIPFFVNYSNQLSIEEMFPKNDPRYQKDYASHTELDTKHKQELIYADHTIPVGRKLKCAFIYDRKIITDNRNLFQKIECFDKAETIFAYSCYTRSMIYSNCVKWELTPYENTNMCGCLTDGEITFSNGKNTFANGTFVVSVVGESDAKQNFNPYAFSHTDSLSADNERMMHYLTDVEKIFSDFSGTSASNALESFIRDCERKLLYSGTSATANSSAMLMDIELRGVDRICFINIAETSMLKNVFGERVANITRQQFKARCATYANQNHYELYELDTWTVAIGVTSYTQSLYDFDKNMRILREKLLETADDCVAIIPFMCLIDDCKADTIFDLYDAAMIEMNQKNIQYSVYKNKTATMNEKAFREKYKIVNILNYAIANDGVLPFYQGIHNNNMDCINHYESLMRILDKDGTIYYPGQFLDVAREFGTLYDTISQIMIQKVFERFDDIENTKVSINLGIRDIKNPKLLEFIIGFLSTAKHPENFIFEMLENEDVNSYEEMIRFIDRIHALGAKISLDDFGSGFSNLQHVINLEFDYIKIDGSIVSKCATDSKCEGLVSLIANWKNISERNISIIAEFVENESIQNILLKYGVDYSQGYLFSRPAAKLIGE